MVRRTSKKSKRKKKKEVNTENFLVLGRVETVRREYLESLRRNQVRWIAENIHVPINEARRLHVNFHTIGHIERQGVIEPLPDPEEQLFDPIDHAPGEPHCVNRCVVIITGHCAICEQILTEGFPEDYPNEFKFCCSCLQWARSIITNRDSEWIINAMDRSPTVKKVYERITLIDIGGERE